MVVSIKKQSTSVERSIEFGFTPQDVTSELGKPEDVFFKSELSHSTDNSSDTDFYFNYFSYGFDVLFDGRSKLVKKFILHTVVPEHEEFGKNYLPCNFKFGEITNNTSFEKCKNYLLQHEPILKIRDNKVSDSEVLSDFEKVTGSSSSSAFIFHSKNSNMIYEFTANGKISLLTFY